MAEEFQYFICKGNDWSSDCLFYGTNDKRGFIVNQNLGFRESYQGSIFASMWKSSWSKNLQRENKAIPATLDECLKLIDKKIYKANHVLFYKTLGIKPPEYKPIELSESTKKLVISMLINERAHNGDSAHKFNFDHFGEGVLDAMVELGLIKQIEDKYYLDTE
jgi:hypothetical protein